MLLRAKEGMQTALPTDINHLNSILRNLASVFLLNRHVVKKVKSHLYLVQQRKIPNVAVNTKKDTPFLQGLEIYDFVYQIKKTACVILPFVQKIKF